MNFLALDLGTTWGWALVQDGELVDSGEEELPHSSEPIGDRWQAWRRWLANALVSVDGIVYEVPFGRFVSVLKIQFGMATIAELLCTDTGREYAGVRPQEIKKFATGKGNAPKADMYTALLDRFDEFGIEPPPADIGENEVDAVWLALYQMSLQDA